MVKITTPEQNEEKLNEHQKIELENISKEELLKALENKQPKQLKEVALSLKLTKNLSNQIRVYSKLHDTSMTNSIEQIITRFFDNKTLTRDYFNPTNEVSISIPLESEIIDKYITGNINLMVDVTETNDKPSINPYDKQNNIINELPSYFNIMHIETINNSLDEYDPINECYYSNYHVGLNGKYQNKFLNHYGLIILETQEWLKKLSHYLIKLKKMLNINSTIGNDQHVDGVSPSTSAPNAKKVVCVEMKLLF